MYRDYWIITEGETRVFFLFIIVALVLYFFIKSANANNQQDKDKASSRQSKNKASTRQSKNKASTRQSKTNIANCRPKANANEYKSKDSTTYTLEGSIDNNSTVLKQSQFEFMDSGQDFYYKFMNRLNAIDGHELYNQFMIRVNNS